MAKFNERKKRSARFRPRELLLESMRKDFAAMRDFATTWVADGGGIEPESVDPKISEDGEKSSLFARTADLKTINKV